jgi:cell division protein FtsL
MKLPKIFYSKIFLIVLAVILLFTVVVEFKQWRIRKQVDTEIANLQKEEQNLKQSNQQLEQSISFLSTPEYQEKLARLQLNLKKDGEVVVDFPQNQASTNDKPTEDKPNSNLYNWWQYIFIN